MNARCRLLKLIYKKKNTFYFGTEIVFYFRSLKLLFIKLCSGSVVENGKFSANITVDVSIDIEEGWYRRLLHTLDG